MIVTIIVIAAVVLLLLALPVFILVRYIPIITTLFVNVTVRRRREREEPFEGETVSFETADGVRLTGTLGAAPDAAPDAPLIVFCHEFLSTRHSVSHYVWFLREAGFRVFTFDFRGHGESGHPTGYVPRQWITEGEVFDLRAALRCLRNRPDTAGRRIGLFGISRGAVAAMVVAGADASVAAVVSDGAFSTSHTIDAYIARWAPIFVGSRAALRLTPRRVFHFYRWLGVKLAQHRLGVRFVDLVPALRRLRVPVFFIHGGKDSYLDVEQAQLLGGFAAGGADLWVVPEADHNEAVDVAPAEYNRRVTGFFRDALGSPARRVVSGVS